MHATKESGAPARRVPLLATLSLGLLASLALTGAALFWLAASPFGQAMLLVHVAVGLLTTGTAGIYLWQHVRELWNKDRGASRQLSVVASITLGGTLATGVVLVVTSIDGTYATATLSLSHAWLAAGLLLCVPLHVATSTAKRRISWRTPRLMTPMLGVPAATLLAAWWLAPSLVRDVWRPIPESYPRTADGGVFDASFTRTENGGFVAAEALTGSEACGGCHQQIFTEWQASVHRFSGVDNPLIAAATIPAEKNGGLPAARFCASCHEPVALLSGELRTSNFGLPKGIAEQGASCLVCHGIASVPSLRGNGEMLYAPPDTFAFFQQGSVWTDRLNRLLVRSFVDEHRAAMRPPLLSNSHQCSSCHTVNAHQKLNGVGFIRLHNENDDWGISAFAHGVGPEREVVRCQDCHMGKESGSTDPVATRHGGTHRSHRFIAANTFVARHFGDAEQLRRTEAFLRGEAMPQEIRHLLPEGPPVVVDIEAPESVAAGSRLTFSVAVANRGVGHGFPAGPNEVNETWVEVTVRQGATTLLHSGGLDAEGRRDPAAFALISIPVNAKGEEVFVTAGLSAGFRLRRAVQHGAADRESYEVVVPPGVDEAVEITARLRYRKSDADFAKLVEGFRLADFPITDVTETRRRIDVTPMLAGLE